MIWWKLYICFAIRGAGIFFSKGEAASAWVYLTSMFGICGQRSYLVKTSHKSFQDRHLQSSYASWLPAFRFMCLRVWEEISTSSFCCRHCCIFADVVLLLKRPWLVSHAGRYGTCLSSASSSSFSSHQRRKIRRHIFTNQKFQELLGLQSKDPI